MPLMLDRRIFTQFDWLLFVILIALPLCSLLVLYSAGYNPDTVAVEILSYELKSTAFVKQGVFFLVGFLVLFAALWLAPQRLERFAYILYAACLFLLLVVLLFGAVSNGSQRWLSLAGIRFQPSELMKIGIILCMARYCSKNQPEFSGYSFRELWVPALLIGIPFLLILKQPDLGTALSVLFIGSMIVLFAGVRIKTLLVMFSGLLLSIVPAWLWILKPYQKRRVLALLNPDADPFGSGYHIIQSKIAVGSGSFFGKGFLQGTQSQLEFLPEHTTDFVFSVLAEEWGFVGSALVVFLYFALIQRTLRVAQRSRDNFSMLFVVGVAVMLFFHVLVNIGMVLGIMPVVGLPLPMFSYGGTAVVTNFLLFGLVLGVGMRRFMFKGMDRVAVVVLFTALLFSNMRQAFAQEEKPPVWDVSIDDSEYESLQTALLEQRYYLHPQGESDYDVHNKGKPWHEWMRDKIELETALDQVDFQIKVKDEKTKQEELLELGFLFELSYFLLTQEKFIRPISERESTNKRKHLNMQLHLPSKTWRVIPTKHTQQHLYIPYKGNIGLVLFIPKMEHDNPNTAHGALLCPRILSPSFLKANLPTLRSLDATLVAIKAKGDAKIKAKVETGFGQGEAKAKIFVSKGVMKPRLWKDWSRNLYPLAELEYLPMEKENPFIPVKNEEAVVGLTAFASVHNSHLHLSESKITVALGIKAVDLKEIQPIKIDRKQYIVDTGKCYGIVRDVYVEHNFKKEALPHVDSSETLESMVDSIGKK